jgi:DNA-binding XRE family transcriptional regulator
MAKLSQNQLARKANIDRQTISNAERGLEVTELTLAKLLPALAAELGRETISVTEVIGR